ncbi:MAG TPA: SRPBCC domain-containing protein [Streptosporangiaceae bacterium]|nr:SRPBCC domain-containing protein [Streptosporangiaceae bacterium]
MKTVSATIEIGAPPEQVWAVLADLAAYPQWNPIFPDASGQIAVGKRLTLAYRPPAGRGMTIRPKVLAVQPGAELRWALSLPGIIGGEHSFILTAVGDGTRVVQSETFRGLLVPLSGKAIAAAQASYATLNQALKKRVERR